MTDRSTRRSFAARPHDEDNWIRTTDAPRQSTAPGAAFTARLTIDVTPDQRASIKIAAFRRGITVADMLRELLAREFPSSPDGDRP